MDPSPPVPSTPEPKAPRLAVTSMVLGILGFILFFIASIPAIITGHIALTRIRRSQGRLGGKSIALTGLVCGYMSLMLGLFVSSMAAIGFYAGLQAVEKAKQLEARKTCVTIDQAVLAFYDEYGRLPGPGNGDKTIVTDQPDSMKVIGPLYGDNVKGIRFIAMRETFNGNNGIVLDAHGKPEAILDPWGNPYHIVIDYDYDDSLPNPFGAGKLPGRRVATYSYGPNGVTDAGKGDDVKSW